MPIVAVGDVSLMPIVPLTVQPLMAELSARPASTPTQLSWLQVTSAPTMSTSSTVAPDRLPKKPMLGIGRGAADLQSGDGLFVAVKMAGEGSLLS